MEAFPWSFPWWRQPQPDVDAALCMLQLAFQPCGASAPFPENSYAATLICCAMLSYPSRPPAHCMLAHTPPALRAAGPAHRQQRGRSALRPAAAPPAPAAAARSVPQAQTAGHECGRGWHPVRPGQGPCRSKVMPDIEVVRYGGHFSVGALRAPMTASCKCLAYAVLNLPCHRQFSRPLTSPVGLHHLLPAIANHLRHHHPHNSHLSALRSCSNSRCAAASPPSAPSRVPSSRAT